ncbi:MAG: ABC transporter permease [Gemmatimonadota bacterium]
MLIEWWRRLMRAFRRSELENGLDEEIEFHIERQIEKNLRLGLHPEEARRRAMLRFGGIERTRESTRDELRLPVLDDLSRDLRYGLRSLIRAPGFAVVSILTLGLGIGAATAVFSVAYGVLVRPLPYPESDRIMSLQQVDKSVRQTNVSEANFRDWQAQSRSYSAMAMIAPQGYVSVAGKVEPSRSWVTAVSREFFDVMQVRPVVGRGFVAEEQVVNGRPAVIVSDAYWKQYLGGTTDFSNQTLTIGNHVYHVVGVMPPGFDYPNQTAIWGSTELNEPRPSRTAHNFRALARLADHATVESAKAELSRISRALKAQYRDQIWMDDGMVVPLQQEVTARARSPLLVLMVASGLLLVIACANVFNLQLVRAGARRRELAVRLAIGASRGRVARQLLAESAVLCISGGVLGVLLTYWGIRTLLSLQPSGLPQTVDVSVNGVVLAFAVGVSATNALILGVATAYQSSGRDLRASLVEGTRTVAGGAAQKRVRDALVVMQVALTLILLTGAGLLTRSFLTLLAVDPGYRIDRALVIDLELPYPRDGATAAQQTRFRDELMNQLRRLPGVTGVGGINDFPLGGTWYANGQFIEMTRPDELTSWDDYRKLKPEDLKQRAALAGFRVASEDYFQVMGIPLIRGRLFQPTDGPDAPHVAVISQALAKLKWPNQDPIGRFIQFGNMDGDLRAFRIVGIVGDVREISLERAPEPLFYGSARQRSGAATSFSIVVGGTDAAAANLAAQQMVRQLDPQLPVVVRTFQEKVDRTLSGRRFSLTLIGVFGSAALILATMGLYGVISYVVAQRTREIGIRIALGASARSLVSVVVGRGATLALVGIAIGLAAALTLTRLLEGLLFGVTAADPIALASVIGLIASAVIVASYLPARRALRVAPIITLRSD